VDQPHRGRQEGQAENDVGQNESGDGLGTREGRAESLRPNGEEAKERGDGIWEMEFFGRMQNMVDILQPFFLPEFRVPRSVSAKLCYGALVNWLEMSEGRSRFFQKSIPMSRRDWVFRLRA
jgi:hypothetical protein